MSKDKSTVWEVFIQSKNGLAHKHFGNVHAEDKEMALQNARDLYTRRNEGSCIWVVKSEYIVSSVPEDEDSFFDPSNDKVNTLLLEDDQKVAMSPKPGSVLNRLGGRFEPSNISNLEKEFPFTGTTMTCVNQNQKQRSPTKSLTFNNITLYLPSMEERLVHNYGDISLESLLDSFVRLEKVDEVTKQQSFAKLPTCLCLHIQRTGN